MDLGKDVTSSSVTRMRSPDSSSSAAVATETSRTTASPGSHNPIPAASSSSSSSSSAEPAVSLTHSSSTPAVTFGPTATDSSFSCQPSASESCASEHSGSLSHSDAAGASMQRQQQEQHQPSDRSPDRLQQAAESQCKASVSQWTEAAAGSLPDEKGEKREERERSTERRETSESRGHKRKAGQGLAADVCSSSSAPTPASSVSATASPSPSSSDRKDSSSGRKHRHHHHRARRGSSSPTSAQKKSRSGSAGPQSSSEKGSAHCSSDSEDEHRMMIDEDAPNDDELVVSPAGGQLQAADTFSSKPASPEASSPQQKVPPLRIVISKSNSIPTPGTATSDSFSQRVTSSTATSSSVTGKAVPHLLVSASATLSAHSSNNSTSSSLREDPDAGASDDEASNASGASGPTNADGKNGGSTSGRVTRSSQRVKELHHQQHQDARSNHHNLRDRGRDKDTDESDTQVTSPISTSSKEVRDEVAAVSASAASASSGKADAVSRKRKAARTKACASGSSATPEKATRSSEKNLRDSGRNRDTASAEPNADEDNESTSSSTSSASGSKELAAASDAMAAGLLKSKEFSVPSYNSYQMYLNIRKAIGKRRQNLMPVQPNPPKGFKDYLMIRGGYLLKDSIAAITATPASAASGGIPGLASPPADLSPGSALYNLFLAQERERHRLRIQHTIEKEKLRLSYEQEILRVHGRAALAVANQTVPYSFCSIIKDDEIYNMIEQENDDIAHEASVVVSKTEAASEGRPVSSGLSNAKGNDYSKNTYTNSSSTSTDLTALTGGPSAPGSRSRYNGRLFLSWIQDVTEKWEKIKTDTILRQRRESESLLAIQKLDWEWKMKELLLCDFKTTPLIDRKLIPSVDVCDDFDLLPSASAV